MQEDEIVGLFCNRRLHSGTELLEESLHLCGREGTGPRRAQLFALQKGRGRREESRLFVQQLGIQLQVEGVGLGGEKNLRIQLQVEGVGLEKKCKC